MSRATELAEELEGCWLENHDSERIDVPMLQAELRRLDRVNAKLVELAENFLKAQDDLDNGEYAGINGEDNAVLLRRKKQARNELEDALTSATKETT